MDSASLDSIHQRLADLAQLPVENQVEELGNLHDLLKSVLDSPPSP
jgi:hypothetical protein